MKCHNVVAVFLISLPYLINTQNVAYNPNTHDKKIQFGVTPPIQPYQNVEMTSENHIYYNQQTGGNVRPIPNKMYQNNPAGFNDRHVDEVKKHPLVVQAVTPVDENPSFHNVNTNYQEIEKNPLSANSDRLLKPMVRTNVGLSSAITKFGLNLLKIIQSEQNGNAIASPFSIAVCLGLLQQGAIGDTQAQISEALQMTVENSANAFKSITLRVKNDNSRNILRLATNVFIANGFTINPDFKRTAINSFGSDVTPMNFNAPQVAADVINRWVAEKTDNKIDKLLSSDSVGQNTQLVLVNAVFFKGLWQNMFNSELTEKKDFLLRDGQKNKVPFMRMRRSFKAGFDPSINSKIVDIPFEGEQYSLMLILPSERSSVDNVINFITDGHLLSYQSLPLLDVQIEIPKFTVRSDIDLNPVLQKMGVKNIFGRNSQLYGLGNFRNFSGQVSSAKHSAVLSIDEQGGTAAASTAFAIVALSYDEPVMTFKANRPFIAILWNNELTMPFFIAKIEDPSA